MFHAISGKDDREASSPSFFNIDEVTVVKTLVDQLRSNRTLRISEYNMLPLFFTVLTFSLSGQRYWCHRSVSCPGAETPSGVESCCGCCEGWERGRIPGTGELCHTVYEHPCIDDTLFEGTTRDYYIYCKK